MEKILDKVIVLALCCLAVALAGVSSPVVLAMLVAVSLSAAYELPQLPTWVQAGCPLLYCLLAVILPGFVLFLPLVALDLFGLRWRALRPVWVLPLLVTWARVEGGTDPLLTVAIAAFCLIACLLAWRSKQQAASLQTYRTKRDDLAFAAHTVELRNRNLRERQDLELRLATLAERSRIAREIHDNVGHLLTRSVLQVEALQVVHAKDAQLNVELQQVGQTLQTAFDAVRASVHDLHDEAYDLQTQLEALAASGELPLVQLDYRCGPLPPQIAYTLLAIVHEALSNSRRHSNASSVNISVAEFPGLYQLTVQDNGSKEPVLFGFGGALDSAPYGAGLASKNITTVRPTWSESERSGIGLTSMEERARALGGVFRTSYDKGFKVFVSIPKKQKKGEQD